MSFVDRLLDVIKTKMFILCWTPAASGLVLDISSGMELELSSDEITQVVELVDSDFCLCANLGRL